jgi:hypothetical protein
MKDALLETFLKYKPADDETFFIFVIVTDDPDTPTWELRQSFAGPYEQTAELLVTYLGQMADAGRLERGARIELYSGLAALRYLAESAEYEARYQRERRGQANN